MVTTSFAGQVVTQPYTERKFKEALKDEKIKSIGNI